MTRYEIVTLLAPTMHIIERYGLFPVDIRNARCYAEYRERKAQGEKVECIVADLCTKYHVKKSVIYDGLRRMAENV